MNTPSREQAGCTHSSNDGVTSVPPRVSFAPLACPPMGTDVTAAHPRVFLTPDAQGYASCPYCGAHYALDTPPSEKTECAPDCCCSSSPPEHP